VIVDINTINSNRNKHKNKRERERERNSEISHKLLCQFKLALTATYKGIKMKRRILLNLNV